MCSDMAMEDIEALRAEGVDLTPRDVVRLNALGLRVERNGRSPDFHVMPRCAFVGGIVLREPTILHEMWMVEAEMSFDGSDADTVVLLRALQMSRAASELPPSADRRLVMEAIEDMKRGPLAGVTVRQLCSAVGYVSAGADPADHEDGPSRGPAVRTESDPGPDGGLVREGVAMRLGKVRDLAEMTYSQLLALVMYQREVEYGENCRKGRHAEALAEYLCVKDEIVERIRNGK